MDAPITVWLMEPGTRRYYEAQWIDPDTRSRKTRSLRTDDPREAERKRQWYEDRLNAGLPVDDVNMPWKEFRERFLSEHAGGLRERSREKFETVFGSLEKVCAPPTVRAIDARCLAKFTKDMRERKLRGGKVGLAPWTQKNYLMALSTALTWAREQGFVSIVPTMPAVRVPKLRPKPVDPSDYEKLVKAAPEGPWRVLLLVAWAAGLRASEAYQLRWSEGDGDFPWVDLGNGGRIWVPAKFSKAWEDQWMPLHPELRAALLAMDRREDERVFWFRSQYGENKEIKRRGVSRAISDFAAKAGVRLGLQKLRRGFGCRLASKVPAAVLQRLMRHASIKTTMEFYASAEDAALREAIDEL